MAKKDQANEENKGIDPVDNKGIDPVDNGKAKKLAELRASLNTAKNTLASFIGTDVFTTLEDDVKEAIVRLAKKASPTSAKASTMGFLQELFPNVGDSFDEFELFKKTKMGRAEMRKKVFYAMKKCTDPATKMWVRFDKDSESWVLDSVGPDCPDNWTDADLPKVRTAITA